MILAKQVLLGLKRLCNQTLITDDSFNDILQSVSSVFLDHNGYKPSSTGLKKLELTKLDLAKECYASLLILLVEASRQCVEPSNLVSTLENSNVKPSRLKSIIELYESQTTNLQSYLKSIGSSQPYIKGITWRLDFCIKSSSHVHKPQPVYFIQILAENICRKSLTDEVCETKKYSFTCSLQQLQELVTKLKDAVRLMHMFSQE